MSVARRSHTAHLLMFSPPKAYNNIEIRLIIDGNVSFVSWQLLDHQINSPYFVPLANLQPKHHVVILRNLLSNAILTL